MRLLFIHSDHLEFDAREEVNDDLAEQDVPLDGRMEDCVTAFIAVESTDEDDPEGVTANAADELRDVAGQMGTRRIVLYPYAHLSDDLGAPDVAKEVMADLEAELADEFETLRAPFGWYKAFEVSCKGHPLSELSRHVSSEADEAEAEAADEKADREPSEWYILDTDGTQHDAIDAKAAQRDAMQSFISSEVEDTVASPGAEPPHLDLMREKQLVGYDDLSDVGNLRHYPRGKLIRDAIIEYVADLVVDYGGMPVETPIMYDLGARCISEHSDAFGERQYRFDSGDRRMMLRFAACFGQFSIMRDMHISVNDLPLRIYELATYAFRREQQGEVMGLKRQRAFTMPDMHTATRDMDEAREEFRRQAMLAMQTGDDLGLDYVAALRVTADFHDDNRDWIASLVDDIGEPVLLEVLPERHHYWSAKIDFAAIDGLGRPIENPTVQIDVESAERFDIEYADEDGTHRPPILHYSPTGGIERVTAALLETVADAETPALPTWLSPTQVRFLPIGDEHVDHCDALVDDLAAAGIRADVDDRDASVGKKIATAETDWVPYYIVVGDDEIDSGEYGVNVRTTGEEPMMTADELRETVDEDVGELPRPARYLPKHLTDHPTFAG
jgi:threonyl-tRNA synthetase